LTDKEPFENEKSNGSFFLRFYADEITVILYGSLILHL